MNAMFRVEAHFCIAAAAVVVLTPIAVPFSIDVVWDTVVFGPGSDSKSWP